MIRAELNIRESKKYRDNPGNDYHRYYQRAINRTIGFLITLLLCTAVVVAYGPAVLVELVLLGILSFIVGFIVCYAVICLVCFCIDSIDWFRGY